jgi:hypothetical protein
VFEDEASFRQTPTLHATWARRGHQPQIPTRGERHHTDHHRGLVHIQTGKPAQHSWITCIGSPFWHARPLGQTLVWRSVSRACSRLSAATIGGSNGGSRPNCSSGSRHHPGKRPRTERAHGLSLARPKRGHKVCSCLVENGVHENCSKIKSF